MPLIPQDPLLNGGWTGRGGPAGYPQIRQPWPVRQPVSMRQADYWRGQTPIRVFSEAGFADKVIASSCRFCSKPEGGADTPGNSWIMVRRPGDQVEIHAGVDVFDAVFPGTSLALEIFGCESEFGSYHWIRPPVTITAAQVLVARGGIGTTLEGGPRFWFASLRFIDLVAAPAYLVSWWIST